MPYISKKFSSLINCWYCILDLWRLLLSAFFHYGQSIHSICLLGLYLHTGVGPMFQNNYKNYYLWYRLALCMELLVLVACMCWSRTSNRCMCRWSEHSHLPIYIFLKIYIQWHMAHRQFIFVCFCQMCTMCHGDTLAPRVYNFKGMSLDTQWNRFYSE